MRKYDQIIITRTSKLDRGIASHLVNGHFKFDHKIMLKYREAVLSRKIPQNKKQKQSFVFC